jgi:hypothetical protein
MVGADLCIRPRESYPRKKNQIPPDLVVESQAIDMAEIILSRIRRPNAVQTLCRNRISRFEQLSTSEAHWSTTKSDGMWENLPRFAWFNSSLPRLLPMGERDYYDYRAGEIALCLGRPRPALSPYLSLLIGFPLNSR